MSRLLMPEKIAWREEGVRLEAARCKSRLADVPFHAERAKQMGGDEYWLKMAQSYRRLFPVQPDEMVEVWQGRLAEWGAPPLTSTQIEEARNHAKDPSFIPPPTLTELQRAAMQRYRDTERKSDVLSTEYQARLQKYGI